MAARDVGRVRYDARREYRLVENNYLLFGKRLEVGKGRPSAVRINAFFFLAAVIFLILRILWST